MIGSADAPKTSEPPAVPSAPSPSSPSSSPPHETSTMAPATRAETAANLRDSLVVRIFPPHTIEYRPGAPRSGLVTVVGVRDRCALWARRDLATVGARRRHLSCRYWNVTHYRRATTVDVP